MGSEKRKGGDTPGDVPPRKFIGGDMHGLFWREVGGNWRADGGYTPIYAPWLKLITPMEFVIVLALFIAVPAVEFLIYIFIWGPV